MEASEHNKHESQPPEPSPAIPTDDSSAGSEEESGPLVGTASEEAPGTGVGGSHPAPAVMRDPDGTVHSAGLPPAGNAAGESAPVGDESDQTSESGFLTPEAREELEAVHEPEQVETERPDLGTP